MSDTESTCSHSYNMTILPEFKSFSKIPRLSRDCVITEKIDGSNAQILITEEGEMLAGSRNRWITLDKDNFGFAAWVEEHKEDLTELGVGRHYGEWYGQGIQRKYGLEEKRFAMFREPNEKKGKRPECVGIVPILYEGPFDTAQIEYELNVLNHHGSYLVPGFMKPEGIVIYHKASGQRFKKTIEGDQEHKGGNRGSVQCNSKDGSAST